MPLAYFITFSTYGTWLHGTEKGEASVDRIHNAYGTPFVAPDREREPGRLMSDLKARASRELNRSNIDANAKRWTRHGSTRHLFGGESVGAAIRYVLDEQGMAMAVYDPR